MYKKDCHQVFFKGVTYKAIDDVIKVKKEDIDTFKLLGFEEVKQEEEAVEAVVETKAKTRGKK